MMSLAPVSVHMGKHYYKAENYYTQEKCIENSEWFGRGAEELGLCGRVDSAVFQNLLEGRSPTSGLTLNQESEQTSRRCRAGLDLTFSAPKSVSIACLVGGDERLIQAHNSAVDAALEVFEERYSQTRSGSRLERKIEVTGNVIAAKFLHDTSRAKDPQIHTHCVVMNAVQRCDGVWRSLHNDAVYENSKLLGLIYQNELAKRVSQLGYDVSVHAAGTFEIDSYTSEQLREFSKRRAKIEELGAENQRDARTLVKVERQRKGPEIPRSVLREGWQREANQIGIVHPTARRNYELKMPESDIHHLVSSGVRHATQNDVSFKRECVEKFVLESGLGKMSWQDIQSELRLSLARGEVMTHAGNGLTTRTGLDTEKSILEMLESGKDRFVAIQENLQENIKNNELGLTQGQWDAVALTLQIKDQFIAWQGVAGAGKTFAINVVRGVAEAEKIPIRGFAPSAEAAKVLETESQLRSTTVAALLSQRDAPSSHKGGLWIVDEAGLLSARDCEALMLKAQEQKARVVFVGDTRQLSSVGAGNPFQLLQKSDIATAYLSEGRRQKSEDLKTAVRALADGNVEVGLRKLENRTTELRREQTRIQHVSSQYLKLNAAERSQTLVLAGTNRERNLLTDAIRARLKGDGTLGSSMQLVSLRSRDLTVEQSSNPIHLREGDVLVFHRSFRAKGIERNVAYEVVRQQESSVRVRGPTGEEMTVCPQREKAFVVYEKRETEFAVGDRVRWTRNDKQNGVRNGQDAIVIAAKNGSISVQNSDGHKVCLPMNSLQHIDHNYVNTVFSSQGKTCDRVIISADSTFGKEALYVAVSRARYDAQIFTEDKEELLRNASVSHAKKSALDLIPEQALNAEKRRVSLEPEKTLSRARRSF